MKIAMVGSLLVLSLNWQTQAMDYAKNPLADTSCKTGCIIKIDGCEYKHHASAEKNTLEDQLLDLFPGEKNLHQRNFYQKCLQVKRFETIRGGHIR